MEKRCLFWSHPRIDPFFDFFIRGEMLVSQAFCHRSKQMVSEGATSGEYGGWGKASHFSVSKYVLTGLATCGRALSCWRITSSCFSWYCGRLSFNAWLKPVFAERERKRPPPWTLPAHGFFIAPLLHCVEWGRHNELEASMVGAVYVHVLRTLAQTHQLRSIPIPCDSSCVWHESSASNASNSESSKIFSFPPPCRSSTSKSPLLNRWNHSRHVLSLTSKATEVSLVDLNETLQICRVRKNNRHVFSFISAKVQV